MVTPARNYFIIETFSVCIFKVMFVSSMLKKCANLIGNNEFPKDCDTSKKEEEVPKRQSLTNPKELKNENKDIKSVTLIHDNFDELSIIEDKENINKTLTILGSNDKNVSESNLSVENLLPSSGKMDCEMELADITISDDIFSVENLVSIAENIMDTQHVLNPEVLLPISPDNKRVEGGTNGACDKDSNVFDDFMILSTPEKQEDNEENHKTENSKKSSLDLEAKSAEFEETEMYRDFLNVENLLLLSPESYNTSTGNKTTPDNRSNVKIQPQKQYSPFKEDNEHSYYTTESAKKCSVDLEAKAGEFENGGIFKDSLYVENLLLLSPESYNTSKEDKTTPGNRANVKIQPELQYSPFKEDSYYKTESATKGGVTFEVEAGKFEDEDSLNVENRLLLTPKPLNASRKEEAMPDTSLNIKTQPVFVEEIERPKSVQDVIDDELIMAMAAMGIKDDEQLKKNVEQKALVEKSDPDFSNGEKLTEEPVVCVVDTHLETSATDIANAAKLAEEIVASVVEDALHTVEKFQLQGLRIVSEKTMTDISDKLTLQEEENAELKLQLNASQQVRATLELQLRQKEEVIIKSQTEALRKDQAFKQEVKQLKEKLEEKCVESDNSQTKDLQEMIKTLKAREAKLLSELNVRKNDEQNYRKIMDEYEKTIAAQLSELQKLNEEHETVKRHLANLELAFSDVHQKYERSKKIIDGYKCNEDALRQTLVSSEDTVIKSEEKYESLKAHAKAQIEKSNQEMQLMRDQYDSELHKLSAIIRRLEIKNASLTDSLDQKTKECSALAALCDEVTGKV